MKINGVNITHENFGDDPPLDELKAYVARARQLVTESEGKDVADNVTSIKVTLCDDNEVDIQWTAHNQRFERIRRITG